MTDEELDERLRTAFADARLSDGKLAELVAQAEPITTRRGWDRWLVGLAVAAALALAIWPAVSDRVLSDTGAASTAPAPDTEPEVAPPPGAETPDEAPVLQVPSGQRAVLVPLAEPIGPLLFIPGIRVDVLASFVPEDDDAETVTVTLLDAVLLAREGDHAARVAVDPRGAEKLAHAINLGTVRLAAHLDAQLQPTDGDDALWRAVTVAAPADELASGFLAPGARVDVLATVPQPDGRIFTRTALADARVLETRLVRGDDGTHGATVSLAVDPDEAEVLAHAAHVGTLSFTRR